MEPSNRYGDLEQIVDEIFGDSEESNQVEATEEVQPEADENVGKPTVAPQDESNEAVEELANSEDESEESSLDEETLEEKTDTAEDSDEDESVNENSGEDDEFLERLVTVKVNGEEMQIPVSQAVKGFQLAAAANQKFEEAAKVRKEAAEAVDFRETFDRLWGEDQKTLISHFVSISDDINGVVEAVILQAAALGKLSPEIAEALQITPEVSQRLAIQHQREQLEKEKQSLQAQRAAANVDPDTVPDEHGYTVQDYRNAIAEIVNISGLGEAPVEERKALVEAVFKHGDDKGITNPYLAYASYREASARREVERSARAKKAVAKVSSNTKTSAALSPKGQVQHTPTAPVMNSTADAATWALQELERKHGAL